MTDWQTYRNGNPREIWNLERLARHRAAKLAASPRLRLLSDDHRTHGGRNLWGVPTMNSRSTLNVYGHKG